jgi:hypothetical protein
VIDEVRGIYLGAAANAAGDNKVRKHGLLPPPHTHTHTLTTWFVHTRRVLLIACLGVGH